MTLTTEWRRRIDRWRETMPRLFYIPLQEVNFEAYLTTEILNLEQVQHQAFKRTPAGTMWGGKWEYAWFRASVTLPPEAKSERIVLRVDVGAESAVYLNGQHAGARDWAHKELTLANPAQGGETFDIQIEAYAGHGGMECGGGPVPFGVAAVPEPPPQQANVGRSTLGIWDEELFQLYYDMETLFQLRETMADQESLRVSEIDATLMQLTLVVDLELPRPEMHKTVRAGRKLLKPLLACRNGSTAPLLFCFGHAHIDVEWLWPLRETVAKSTRTFGTALALMEEYPDYKFLQSQAQLYDLMKIHYPELYARIRAAIARGQWIADGGMWVEADTNISSGESLIRQFMHGKRFFRDEFGVENEVMWLPDVFGYSGNMPQIMRGCGIKYFSTAKIYWNYNGGDPFPYTTFTWEGIDGSHVLVSLSTDYNSQTNPGALTARWNERRQKVGLSTRLVPYGWGDGGGGPTREHMEFLSRSANLEGLPRTQTASLQDYFTDLEKRGYPADRYVGELYFQAHRGTYTSQARTKKGNRKSELALREAEMWGAAAGLLSWFKYPQSQAEHLWKLVLLNQFHDIIPGSSIHRVYEEAEGRYTEVIGQAGEMADSARASLVEPDSEAAVVFNSLSWERDALVTLPEGFEGAVDDQHQPVAVQAYSGKTYAMVNALPACGWTTLRKTKAAPRIASAVKATRQNLENELVKFTFNASGEITSIHDKASGQEFAAGVCNRFKLYKDVPTWFDAWDIDSMYKEQPVEIDRKAAIEVGANGPLFASLRVTRQINQSILTQEITLRQGSRRLDFVTAIDWQESHKLLKVAFPVSVRSDEAIHEIQFGHIHRPTHASRQYDADRFEVCNHKWSALVEEGRGVAVLNDSKYGLNVADNSINLTLLKSPLAPDMTADKGMQIFTYAFTCWSGSFKDSGVVQTAYDLNVPVKLTLGHAQRTSLFSLDSTHIIIETVKAAEDGSGDVIVRLYESMRTAAICTLTTSLPCGRCVLTDMLENPLQDLEMADGKLRLSFRPFEVKTLRLMKAKTG